MGVNIVLTGLMGCGKTTVGKALSKELKGYIFIDLDEVIVDLEGMSIPDIFAKKSENYFRELEERLIEEFSQEENLIIALGGGAFESEANRDNLSETGKVFYLKAGIDTLYERVKNDTNRPLLNCENPKDKLKELLKKRESNYLKAEYTVDITGKKISDIVSEIVSKV